MRDPLLALGSRVPARWRIVGWVMMPAVVGVVSLVVTVSNTLHADNATESNEDIVQEIREFRQFAADGRDPETARPFESAERLFETYLGRQTPARNELFIGRVADGQIFEVRGNDVTHEDWELLDDAETLAAVLDGERSGVRQTQVGEIRWGTQTLPPSLGSGTLAVVTFSAPLEAEVDRITRLMLVVGLVVLLIIAAMSWFIAGQILRPVRAVRQAAEVITEQDLTRRIPVTGDDDIAELAVQFNGMLDRLELAFDTQQRFVDDAGHELRTPITVIRGHLELMGDDPAEQRATLDLVTTELDRMSRIVTDLLALAKAERPDFVRPVPGTDLSALTLDIDAKVQALGDRRWVLTRVADGHAAVDPQRITQAVLQLAANAVQHTGLGDTVRVASEFVHRGGRTFVQFSVSDDGPGVRPEDAERIFERFARGRNQDPKASGAGLGLAIVKAIATGHGGRVNVESVPGHGATFQLLVPLAPSGHPPDDSAEVMT